MKNLRRLTHVPYFFMIAVVSIISLSLVMSGCETMRRKFTRKKKQSASENMEIPVLQPIGYPKKIYSPEEIYAEHYSLWKVWYGEFLTMIQDYSDNRKRQLFLLNKSIDELEGMKALLNEDVGSSLSVDIQGLKSIYADLKAPVMSKSFSTLRLDAVSFDKKIRKTYTLDKMKDSLRK